MQQDNFANRYLIKVGSSVLLALLNMVIQMILPRALTETEYGFYTYNLNVFTSVVVLANLSASNAMVAKYSKRNHEIGIVWFYLKYFALISLLLNVIIIILYPFSLFQHTFAGQTLLIVLLGIESVIVNKLLTDCISLYDACAISRVPAVGQIIMKAIVSIVIVAGYVMGKVDLVYFYAVQIAVMAIITAILLIAIIKNQMRQYPQKLDLGTKQYLKEYFEFCRPLILATIVAQLVTILMNWALMNWAGAAEEAVFGVAWQLNSLVSYVFSPYAELSKREFAVLYNDEEGLKERFIQALKLMSWLTSYFAIFIAITSDWLLPVIYGNKYSDAMVVTALIMLYTIYQAWGQITGSFMIALELTGVNAVISIIGQALTVCFIFLFQMPNAIWPLGLGAVGIALNYLLANIITTSIAAGAISRRIKTSIWKTVMLQFPPMILCTVFTICVRKIVESIMGSQGELKMLIVKTFITGLVYSLLVIGVIFIRPSFIGVSRSTLKKLMSGRKK